MSSFLSGEPCAEAGIEKRIQHKIAQAALIVMTTTDKIAGYTCAMDRATYEIWKTDSVAEVYLAGARAGIPFAQEQIDMMLRLIENCGAPVLRFMDLGCGDGVLAQAILERFPQAEGVLADFSEPMLEAARKRFAHRDGSVHFVSADYGVPTWRQSVEVASPYDVIVSGYSIHHQPDTRKREVYGELLGLLRHGGIFLNVEHVSSPSDWIKSVNDGLFVDNLQRQHPGQSREEVTAKWYERSDKAANILAPVELQCQWLREFGFADVDCYFKVFEFAVFGGRKP